MQTIAVIDKYTKAQRELLNKFDALFGKEFNEESLIKEINKIVDRSKWVAERVKGGVCVLVNALGLTINVRFNYTHDSRKNYKLYEILYL